MKNIKNDYCIKMFTDHGNNLRPLFNKVNMKGGFLYATDSHCLAKIDSKNCIGKYKEHNDYPNAEKVLSDFKKAETICIKIDDLFKDLMKIDCCFAPKMSKCGDCDGGGSVECLCCGNDSECNECSGTGLVESDILELTSEYHCKINEAKYKLSYIDRIIKSAIILGEKEIELTFSKDNYSSIFKFGNFTIMLMQVQ
jgi:hypothetical protein